MKRRCLKKMRTIFENVYRVWATDKKHRTGSWLRLARFMEAMGDHTPPIAEIAAALFILTCQSL